MLFNDLIGPVYDTTLQIIYPFIAVLYQDLGSLSTSLAAAAIYHHILIFGNLLSQSVT